MLEPQPNDPTPRNLDDMPEERAARRFHQIRHLSDTIGKLDTKITAAKTKLAALKDEREGVIATLMAASRDEGDLPLFADFG